MTIYHIYLQRVTTSQPSITTIANFTTINKIIHWRLNNHSQKPDKSSQRIEDKLEIPFPWHLVKRKVPGYYLHTGGCTIKLDGEGEVSYALRRIQFDTYLLQKARESGATIIRSKVRDVEIDEGKVTVYSETKHTQADVVGGAVS